MDLEKSLGKVPWITKDGFVDPATLPIDRIMKQALSDDRQEFRAGLHLLRSMYGSGRQEAGVFLLGLLLTCEDNWERRIAIVEILRGINTKACADLLFGELKRVKSSNTTRRYLMSVFKVLAYMPSELVLAGFESLAEDKSFSYKMRDKFKTVLGDGLFDDRGFW